MCHIGAGREPYRVPGGAVAIVPYPPLQVALPHGDSAEVGERGGIAQAVGGIVAEEGCRVRTHIHGVADGIAAAVGVGDR